MLPPLGLSLTSVTLRVDRLFCLEVFEPPASPEMIFLLFLPPRVQKLSEPQTCGGERLGGCLMSKIKFLQIRH